MKKSVTIMLCVLNLTGSGAVAQDMAATADSEWRGYVEPLAPIAKTLLGDLPTPADAQLRLEMYRALMAGVSVGYLVLFNADPRYPDFTPYTTQAFNALGNNPDNDYYVTPIEDSGVYRISGYRGTVKRIDFQIGSGMFLTRGDADEKRFGETLANHDLDEDARIQPDGSFDVILSRERPKGYTGDWWELGAGANNVFVRQISYDWLHEIDGRLAIERLDTAATKPRPSAADLDRNLKQISRWAEQTVIGSAKYAQAVRAQQGINKMGYKDMSLTSAIGTQRYAYGGFDIEADEALVVEARVPETCRYWGMHLLDDIAYMHEWMNRQSSLNGFMMHIDKDGKFRAVISARDPGVPNWLDTGGCKTGLMQVRWERCSSWPEHTVTRIKVADVRRYVPADTPVISAEQRDAALRLRRKGAQMRKRW